MTSTITAPATDRRQATVSTRRGFAGRTHLWFLIALVGGIAIRVVVSLAYHPGLLFSDTFVYERLAGNLSKLSDIRPSGYPAFLALLGHFGDARESSVIAQHVLTVLLAVACYALMVRRGLPTWGATLALLPLFFDPLQLCLEHYLLSDSLFEILLVGACVPLLWNRRPGFAAVVASGLMVYAATVTRGAGMYLAVAFVIALLCLRVHWTKVAAFLVALAIPLGMYMSAFHSQYGKYAVLDYGPRFLYARLATFVDCKPLQVPSYERNLCPPGPATDDRMGINWYLWGEGAKPQFHLQPPPGKTQVQVVKDWDKRVLRDQPGTFARHILVDGLRAFGPVRTSEVKGNQADHWLFNDHYWTLDNIIQLGLQPPSRLKGTSSNHDAAAFLTEYRHYVWTPGPVLALLSLLAAWAAFGMTRRSRFSGQRVATGLFLAACFVPLGIATAVSGFSWRYQMPQVPLIPMAAAFGIAALSGTRPGHPISRPYGLLDRITGPVARRLPRRLSGAVAPALAVVVAVVVAVVATAGVVLTGWLTVPWAAALGVLGALVLLLLMLVSWARARRDHQEWDRDRGDRAEPARRT